MSCDSNYSISGAFFEDLTHVIKIFGDNMISHVFLEIIKIMKFKDKSNRSFLQDPSDLPKSPPKLKEYFIMTIIKRTCQFVEKKLRGDSSGHDWWHNWCKVLPYCDLILCEK